MESRELVYLQKNTNALLQPRKLDVRQKEVKTKTEQTKKANKNKSRTLGKGF